MQFTRSVAIRWTLLFLVVGLLLPQMAAQAQDSTIYVPVVSLVGQQSANSVAIQASDADVAATVAAWTPAMRASAVAYGTGPFAMSRPSAAAVAAAAEADAALIPGYVSGGSANPAALRAAQQEFPEEWAAINQMEAAAVEPAAVDGTAGVFTTYSGNQYTAFWAKNPYMEVGKLYFITWDGYSSYCSASVISANNVIVTAAHCLYDTDYNRWHQSWRFVPAERNGTKPYGEFTWRSARIPTPYISAATWNAAIRYDVALITLNKNSYGRGVSYYTGYLGRTWDNVHTQSITEIGYPSNFTTLYTRIGHAETRYNTADVLSYGSNMGQGASGSPLIIRFTPYQYGAINYVNGVQSGSNVVPVPTDNLAPRFTTGNFKSLCDAEGC